MTSRETNNDIPLGFTLRHILSGHTEQINRFAWSPDGHMLASPSYDKTIRLWDAQTGRLLKMFEGRTEAIPQVAWSPDGRVLASGSLDGAIWFWDVHTGNPLRIIRGHSNGISSVAWSPDGQVLASGSWDKTIQLWDAQTGHHLRTLETHFGVVRTLAWSPNGQVLASGSEDKTIQLWDRQTRNLQIFEGSSIVFYVEWLPDRQTLASAMNDSTIQIRDIQERQMIRALEGHAGPVCCLSFSGDGHLLASKSSDRTVCVWHTSTWDPVATLSSGDGEHWPPGVAFHPHAPILATLNEDETEIYIWDLDVATLLSGPATASTHYTTAKIALVGDSGVGKSGMGYRLAEDRFQITESTHGQQFWVVDKLGKTRQDGTQCEAVLWDFAGQPNFRPIHALFLDDIDLALMLFDPSRQETLTGVDYWLKQLMHKQQSCRTMLVAARTDVSTLSTSPGELEAFCQERNISGGFIATSAKKNEGIDTLLEIIRQQIDWDAKPTTVTTATFKRIKDHVLGLKADAGRKNVLVSPAQLRILLETAEPGWQFSNAEMMAAVGHLQNHGYVTILRRSSDDQSILLAPDVLINLTASYLLKAQVNEKGLGTLEESRALRNDYKFQELENLNDDERDILLNAATELFLDRNICFRESVDNRTFLIFPSLIADRPPRMIEDTELIEDVTYVITGLVENLYPALVVLLGYAPSFQRMNQWRKQARYETVRGEICGFKQTNDEPGELELVLYYAKSTPEFVRARFQGLFEEILHTHNVTISRFAPISCPKCARQQERSTIIRLIQEGKKFLFCPEDGKKINLPKLPERTALSREDRAIVDRDEAISKMRTTYETALVRVKGFIRDRNDTTRPTCFVSYAWGNPEQKRWVRNLANDLRKADIDIILDQWDNPATGASIPRFISRIEQSDFILAVGTPAYRQKYENQVSEYGSVVAAEVDLINVRLTGTEVQKASVLPVLLEGNEHTSFPPLLHRRVHSDFTREEYYFATLFDLVLTLYGIPFDHTIVQDLRAKLEEDAEIHIPQSRRRVFGISSKYANL